MPANVSTKPTYASVASRSPTPEAILASSPTPSKSKSVAVARAGNSSRAPAEATKRTATPSQSKEIKPKKTMTSKQSEIKPKTSKQSEVKTRTSKQSEIKTKTSKPSESGSKDRKIVATSPRKAKVVQPDNESKEPSTTDDNTTPPISVDVTETSSAHAGDTTSAFQGDREPSSDKKNKQASTKKASRQRRAQPVVPAESLVTDGSDDEVSDLDAGAVLDPDDKGYRGHVSTPRIVQPTQVKTRSSSRLQSGTSIQSEKPSPSVRTSSRPSRSDPQPSSREPAGDNASTTPSRSKRTRTPSMDAALESDNGSVFVARPKPKRVKVVVEDDPDLESVHEDDHAELASIREDERVSSDVDMDVDPDNDDEGSVSANDTAESCDEGSGCESESCSEADRDANFIDDAAIESDNSETEAHDSDIGSDTRSIRDIDEDRGSDSGTDTQSMHDNDCEPPTPAQPPHRQPSPISSTPPHSPSPDPQTPVKSPPKSSARAGTKSKQPTRVLGVDRTGKLASVSATPTESTKGGDQAAASTGSFKRLVKGRRTFGSVMSKPSDKATAGEVYLADLEYISFKTLPDVCAVTDLRLQDPELMHTYADRPNLKSGQLIPWNDARGRNMVMFSAWVDTCPHMDYENAFNVIDFVQWGRYINPSTISPLDVLVRKIPGSYDLYHLYTANRQPAICVSLVSCSDSFLFSYPSTGIKHKRIGARFHSQEWERFVGFMCTVFDQSALQAQLCAGVLQVSTRSVTAYGGASNDPPGTPSPAKSSKYSAFTSPAIGAASSSFSAPKRDPFTLEPTDNVPVYDCTDIEFNMKTDLDKLATLPVWSNTREIPPDSCVAVAYTTSSYRGKRGPTISLNIQWVIVIATP